MNKYIACDNENYPLMIGSSSQIARRYGISPNTINEQAYRRACGTNVKGRKYNFYYMDNEGFLYYRLTKKLLVKKKINGQYRLIRLNQGDIYILDPKHNRDKNVIKLARKVEKIDKTTRRYYDELRCNIEDFGKYFKEV